MRLKHTADPSLGLFERRWIAEALRLLESDRGPVADADAVRRARQAGGVLEERVLARADVLGEREGLRQALHDWRGFERMGLVVAALLALVGGFGMAVGVLGDGSRAVNVVWALGGLLGVHLFGLLLWLIGMGIGGRDAGGWLGRAWQGLTRRLARGGPAVLLARARTELLRRADLNRWALGAVTHFIWMLVLLGALVGMVVLFMLRSYQFVWETTILSGDTLTAWVAGLGWLPGLLGLEVPDTLMVQASGQGLVAAEEARRAWAQWLLGCVLVYGLIPRALLWLGCASWFWRRRAGLKLDLALPGYLALADRLMPASERIGITDPDHVAAQTIRSLPHHMKGVSAPTVIGIELRPEQAWPPPLAPGVTDGGRVDDRLQRKSALARLAAAPPERLLLACDVRLSPDRGSLGLIAELSACAADCRIWLVGGCVSAPAPAGERLEHWQTGLAGQGFAPEQLFCDEERALAWLAHGDA